MANIQFVELDGPTDFVLWANTFRKRLSYIIKMPLPWLISFLTSCSSLCPVRLIILIEVQPEPRQEKLWWFQRDCWTPTKEFHQLATPTECRFWDRAYVLWYYSADISSIPLLPVLTGFKMPNKMIFPVCLIATFTWMKRNRLLISVNSVPVSLKRPNILRNRFTAINSTSKRLMGARMISTT